MSSSDRINRALWEIERQRTSGEWSLCKIRDLLTGDEPAHLRDDEQPRRRVEEWLMCEPQPRYFEVDPGALQCGIGALYTPPAEYTELLASDQGGT